MTRQPEGDSVATLARSSAWLLTSRLAAMVIGLIGLPVLMSALGPLQFGAWAVLLGGTFAFGTLELGMSSAVMRWVTLSLMPESRGIGNAGIDAILSNSVICTAMAFTMAGVPIWLWAEPLAAWLQLPATAWLSPGQCILVVYTTVAIMAVLRCTIAPMLAARRMGTHAAFTLAQSIVGAAATWTAAWTTQRLDLVLVANAVAIIAVQCIAAWWTRRTLPWRFAPRTLDRRLARSMLGYGAALQFSDLSSFFMYQFDKLIIAGVVSPTEVAHYEVASRSAQALGNVSTAPFVAFAPLLTERHGRSEDPSEDLLRILRITLLGVGAFMLLPLAVSPIGLFAWVGQIGYHAAGVFALLALAVIGTAMILPLSMCAQAMGRPQMELARSAGAMLINVPVAWAMIHAWGKEGAALGTLSASLVANAVFAAWLLKAIELPASRIVHALSPLIWPIVTTFGLVAVAAYAIEPLVIVSRWRMAPAAVGLYALGLIGLGGWLIRARLLLPQERELLARLPLLGGRWMSLQR